MLNTVVFMNKKGAKQMRKYLFALGCYIVLCNQTICAQEYIEGNTYYDNNGKAYFYDENGKAFYYPEHVAVEDISDNTKSADSDNIEDNKSDVDSTNYKSSYKGPKFVSAEWWKTATLENVKEEIAKGANVNAKAYDRAGQNSDGDLRENVTPLMFALKYGKPNAEMIQALIDAGADINAKEKVTGLTVLMYAVDDTSDVNIIETLIKHGADVNAKKDDGWTALMLAAYGNKNSEVIEKLIGNGANVNDKNDKGATVLMYAAEHNQNPEVIETLIKNGADVNAYLGDVPIATAVYIALSENPNHQILETLIKGEIDKFCHINRSYSKDIYYCKDRLTNYMQKEHLLPSCTYNIGAMIGLTPVIQAMPYSDPGKGAYAFVALAELTSQLNCSITNTFKELGISW